MARFNWTLVATWAVPLVCLILAITMGYWKLNEANRAEMEKNAAQRKLGLAKLQEDQLEKKLPQGSNLALVASTNEEYIFTKELQRIWSESGVKLKSMDKGELTALPDYTPRGSATGKPGSNEPNMGQLMTGNSVPNSGQAAQTPSYSVKNLPRGARAISTRLKVRGTYPQLRAFLYRLKNYRYQVRALNINEAKLYSTRSTRPEESGLVEVDVTLTRFVRPEETPPANQVAGATGAAGNSGPIAR